jgi:hypothetical protein
VGLLSCDEIAAKAQSTGTRLLLAGTLNDLKLQARLFKSSVGGESRFQVDANKLSAEIGRVSSGSRRVGGGMMDLAGAKLYITNPARILALSAGVTGTLEIEAWNRIVAGAVMSLPGGGSWITNLAPVNPSLENVKVRVNMEDGATTLWSGNLRGALAQPIQAASIHVGPVTLEDAAVTVQSTLVTANGGNLSARLERASGSSARALLARPTVTTEFSQPSIQWERADSPVQQSADQLALQDLSLTNAVFSSGTAQLRSTNGMPILLGQAEARLRSLTSRTIAGKSSWSRVEAPAFPFMLPPGSLESLAFDLDGNLDNPRLHGNLAASQFAVGPIGITHALSLAFDLAGGAAELRFPFHFKLGPLGAGVVLRDPDQTAAITATLANADLTGTVVLTLPDVHQSRLEVPKDQLRLALTTTVATKPLLAGVAPSFGSAQVDVVNRSAISAGERSSGSLKLSTDVLVLGQPILKIGDKGKESASTLQLTASGRASAGYDLATGKMSVLKGSFSASDIDFALLDPTGSLDLSGMVVTSPRVHLGQLSIDIDEEQQPSTSHAALRALSVTASHVSRPFSPDHPKEVTFEAKPSQGLTIASVEASRTSIADSVTLQQVTVRTLDFDLREVSAGFGEGFNMTGATMQLKADAIESVVDADGERYKLTNASFSANGRLSTAGQVHINGDTGFQLSLTVSGNSDRLKGSGRAKLGGFTGSMVTTLPIELACRLNLPVEYNFAVGGADLDVKVEDGDFGGEGSLAPIALALHSTGGASCDTSPPFEHVISEERKISMTGVCCCPPKFCEWSTTIPKVALRWHERFEIHVLAGTATLTNPRLSLHNKKLKVCHLGPVSVAAPPGGVLVAGGVSPQIDTNVPGADAIINPILSVAFDLAESTTATAIANGVGIFASSLATSAGNLLCLAQ